MGFLLIWSKGHYETLAESPVCHLCITGSPLGRGKAAVLVAQSHNQKFPLQQGGLEAKHLREREEMAGASLL